jgi:hypothetical protein
MVHSVILTVLTLATATAAEAQDQANVFYVVTSRLQFGVEVGRWHTRWVGLPDGKVIRIEPAVIYAFSVPTTK